MSGTDIQTAVDDMLAELMNEGIADKGDYLDSDTELLMCGKCHTKKQTLVKLMGRTMKLSCLCRCRAEELEKEKQEREERELIEGISRLKSAGLQDNTFFRVYLCKLWRNAPLRRICTPLCGAFWGISEKRAGITALGKCRNRKNISSRLYR